MTSTLNLRLGRAPFALSSLLAVAALGAAATSFARPDLLHGPAVSVGSLRGTAIVILVVALPLLLASMTAARAGSTLALFGWIGAVGFIGYQSVLFLFGTPFNGLFPLYLGMLAFAGWTLIVMAPRLPVAALGGRFGPRTPVRLAAGYLTVMAGLFYLLWFRAIVPALFASEAPAFLEGTGMTTGPGQIMDLAFLLPLCLLTAAWTWARRPAGMVLSGVLLVALAIEAVSIGVDQWFGSSADPASTIASADMVPVFAVVTVIGVAVLALFMRGTRADQSREVVPSAMPS